MPKTQAERSAQMKQRLVDAAVRCLVDSGYAATTRVAICREAGVTRGAYHHHYADNWPLFADVIETLYARFATLPPGSAASLESMVLFGCETVQRPEFKAIIELWLACRNDADLGERLYPVITRAAGWFDPEGYPALSAPGADLAQLETFYRLAFEAMIGIALGVATSPPGRAPEHHSMVIERLAAMARELDETFTTGSH